MTISRVADRSHERFRRVLLIVLLAAAACHADRVRADDHKPKFGPHATTILQSHQYLRTHRAPDYWALSPYYVPQVTRASCSLATVTILLNALRGLPPYSDGALVTQESLLKATAASNSSDSEWVEKTKEWSDKVKETGSPAE